MLKITAIPGGSIGTNCYILEDNNDAVLIDYVPEVLDIIKKKGLIPQKLLITHIHFDHFEGLYEFQKIYNIELYLSVKALENINSPMHNLSAFASQIGQTPEEFKIDLTYAKAVKDNDIIKFNEYELIAFESPGHSEDSMMYIMKKRKCVFTGDTVFQLGVGRTDLPGGSHEALLSSIKRLFSAIDDEFTLYPGHGPETQVIFEKKNNYFLK